MSLHSWLEGVARSRGDFFLTYTHNVNVPPGGQGWTFDSNRMSARVVYTFRY